MFYYIFWTQELGAIVISYEVISMFLFYAGTVSTQGATHNVQHFSCHYIGRVGAGERQGTSSGTAATETTGTMYRLCPSPLSNPRCIGIAKVNAIVSSLEKWI